MDAKEWMIEHIRSMPFDGVLNIKDHPQEDNLRELGKTILIEYNDIFRENGYEIEFSNDYASIKKIIYPF